MKDIIAISAGGGHLLALDGRGRLFAWGSGTSGQLGQGDESSARGAAVRVMKGLEQLDGVAAIGTGFASSYAVRTDGTLYAWGSNAAGELGLGNTNKQNSPTVVPGIKGVRAVAGGYDAAYAITRDGAVWSWGANDFGQLGDGTTTSKTEPTKLSKIGPGTSGGRVRQVIGTRLGAGALMADGKVMIWGTNTLAQNGKVTSATYSASPVAVPAAPAAPGAPSDQSELSELSDQVALSGGWGTWAAADRAGNITVWGATAFGQRGDGTTSQKSTPTPYRGSASPFISPYAKPGEFVRGARDATGNLTTATFDKLGNNRAVRSGRGNDMFTSAFDVATTYDASSRPVTATTAENRKGSKSSVIDYDQFGNPVRTTDARGIATRSVFDALNRKIAVNFTRKPDQAPEACTTIATAAEFTDAQNGDRICSTTTVLDGVGRTVSVTDANSQVSKQWFDAAGRNIRTDTPRGPGVTLTSRQVYDADGNVIRACTPLQNVKTGTCAANGNYATHQTWDRAGRLATSTRYRESGSGSGALVTSTVFDADGNPISITDANGHPVTATYDLLDRRQKMVRPRDADTSNTTSYKYDASGNTTSVSAPGSTNTGTGKDGVPRQGVGRFCAV